ncbi:fibrobacter succinogenes major paralogous domain-containing protein [uncultured Fibrobacter sp.]|uniref:fibrobacter succinogenes major paralogous domain-containing protein n=1 Tax=uncultured Fibrobacter sp. TaxID=261512 RepID=UPI0025FF6083|nr:fibrobacter succinogenes major paralogous domain-containing protein [uncultured Fibrobacter sp.]
MKKSFSVTALFCSALIFNACGGDSSSEPLREESSVPEDGSSVESIYDLGKCTSDREGDVIFVEDDEAYYKCKDKDWKETETPKSSSSKKGSSASKNSSSSSKDGSSSGSKGSSSASKDKSSNSKDGSSASNKDGSSASKDGSSSSKGDSSSSNGSSSTENKSSSSAKPISSSIPESSSSVHGAGDEVKNVAISKKTFTGVAEKGPFVSGSTIKLMELDEVLDPTGTSFEWEVTTDLGAFTSVKVTLESQYALMQANGYYYNENAAAKTSGQLTIKSLVDLKDRDAANVNILGHLAHKRAIYLFAQSGKYKNVPAAKSAAEREVLAAFGWPTNNHAFEDLSIYGTFEDDAKLLAASILLQGSLTDADIASRVATISTDLEEDGLWNGDSTTKVAIADWAMDTKRNYSAIRAKLGSMNKTVPYFEKYINMYASQIYGLGVCTADLDAEMKGVANIYSVNDNKTYICDADHWRLPSTMEVKVGTACTEGKKGAMVLYPTTSSLIEEYVCDGGEGNWRVADVYDYDKSEFFSQAASVQYGSLKDTRDGKTYKTVVIGLQTWMAENLNYYDELNENLVENSWCYKNKKENCEVGGRLYSWTAAMNIDSKYLKSSAATIVESPHRGICPEKWHVPDTTEWRQLKTYVAKMEGVTSTTTTNDRTGVLKARMGWKSYSTSTAPTSSDKYGFSAIPTGAYYGNHANPSAEYSRLLFDDVGYFANFWSSVESATATGAIYWFLDYRYGYLSYYTGSYNQKDKGFSLRCVKDKE